MDNSNNNDMEIGILDPTGKHINPLTGRPYSNKYKELAEFWSKLPVYRQIHQIIDDIKQNQVLLIISSTGSGKSILIPKAALHVFNYTGKVVMTLPKTIITVAAAEFAALTLDVRLGVEVGFQFRNSPPEAKSNKTKILYCTDGTLIAKIYNDPLLKEFDCAIIDEAHDRSTNIDLLIYLLRETLRLRPEFKVIFMSATIDSSIFVSYFREFKFININVGGERLFPIASHFLDKSLPYNEVINKGFQILTNILETDDPTTKQAHDIIFFVTSANEAFTLCKMLNNHLQKEKNEKCKITCHGDVLCIETYAGMPIERQNLAQDKDLYKLNTNYNRKVVIGTNVIESSLTIANIRYVIDTGYEFSSAYDPENRAKRLDRQLITQAQAKQRMGRAGRTEPGECYHLYTKEDFENNMKKFPEPDIKTSDITSECLRLLNNPTINNIENLVKTLTNFIEPPKEEYIRVAVNSLIQLGAIEQGSITKFGKLVNEMSENNLFLAIAIIFGKIYDCSKEVMKIAAIVDAAKGKLGDLYDLPTNKQKPPNMSDEDFRKMVKSLETKFDSARSKFSNKYGDHLSLLNIYMKFKIQHNKHKTNMPKLDEWCHDNFLKVNPLLKAIKNYKKLKQQVNNKIKGKLDATTIDIPYHKEIDEMELNDKVLACLLLGYRLNTAVRKTDTDFYKTQFSKENNIKINKLSFLLLKSKAPANVFYNELFISMGKSELVLVSEIPKILIKILS